MKYDSINYLLIVIYSRMMMMIMMMTYLEALRRCSLSFERKQRNNIFKIKSNANQQNFVIIGKTKLLTQIY